MTSNIQQHSLALCNIVSQDWAWFLLIIVLIAGILYFGSDAAIGKRTTEEREVAAWLLMEGLIGATAAGAWRALIRVEDAIAYFFILVIMALRVYIRVKFYHQRQRERVRRDLEQPVVEEVTKDLEVKNV